MVLSLLVSTAIGVPNQRLNHALQAVDSLGRDSMKVDSLVSPRVKIDSAQRDLLRVDSLQQAAVDTTPKGPKKPLLDAPINIKFQDSLVYEPQTKDFLVYKQGEVTYEGKVLKADFMKLKIDTKSILARGVMDTTTKTITRTTFVDEGTNYDMDSIAYNMDSGKAMIHGVHTKEGEGILFGGKVKKMKDNVVHMHNGRYTTCDAKCPHFYL
ncbi:MAG: LPS-assembly protein LptD, partial [Mucinivorans sp.]